VAPPLSFRPWGNGFSSTFCFPSAKDSPFSDFLAPPPRLYPNVFFGGSVPAREDPIMSRSRSERFSNRSCGRCFFFSMLRGSRAPWRRPPPQMTSKITAVLTIDVFIFLF